MAFSGLSASCKPAAFRLSGWALAGMLVSSLLIDPALASSWTVDREASSLGFSVPQGDSTLTGKFDTWDAEIDFDPDNVEAATIRATIDTSSATTGNPQFDGMLPTPDWFDVASFSEATFVSDEIEALGGNAYRANGLLTIRGMEQPVTLDFTLDIDGDTAIANGTASVDRLAHELGKSVGEAQVGQSVAITVELTAKR